MRWVQVRTVLLKTGIYLAYSWLLQQELIDSRVSVAKSEAAKLVLEKQIKALDLSALVAKHYIDILVKQERLKPIRWPQLRQKKW